MDQQRTGIHTEHYTTGLINVVLKLFKFYLLHNYIDDILTKQSLTYVIDNI